jgi:hypothetical protein
MNRTIIITIILSILLPFMAYSEEHPKFAKARLQFYGAIEDEDLIDMTIELFEEMILDDRKLTGVAKTYIGSLTAMKAAHTIWPHKKMSFANDGIDIMAEGIAFSPNNIESLFIQGSTLFHLPFFFGKSDDAENNFKKIIRLLDDDTIKQYDKEMLSNAIEFILENAELTDAEKRKAITIKQKLDK